MGVFDEYDALTKVDKPLRKKLKSGKTVSFPGAPSTDWVLAYRGRRMLAPEDVSQEEVAVSLLYSAEPDEVSLVDAKTAESLFRGTTFPQLMAIMRGVLKHYGEYRDPLVKPKRPRERTSRARSSSSTGRSS